MAMIGPSNQSCWLAEACNILLLLLLLLLCTTVSLKCTRSACHAHMYAEYDEQSRSVSEALQGCGQ